MSINQDHALSILVLRTIVLQKKVSLWVCSGIAFSVSHFLAAIYLLYKLKIY